ncbi:MAG TPA: MFS transporter [Balneolaceae bacterium]|nr:MFS transporter [Balneolaceae bacterium]
MKKRTQLATVFFVVLIDLMGFGIVLPLLPFYAKNFQASAVVVGLLYSVYSFAQLIFSPIWGSYSDRIGRRPIMLLSTFGAVIAYIMFGLANSLFVLFASRIVAGVMGGNISTAQAYISDITSTEDRAKGMGLIGAAFGIGFMVGPALATALIHDSLHSFIAGVGLPNVASWMAANKYALPGFFAAFMSFCSFSLVLFKLPETVDKNAPRPDRDVRSSVFSKSFWQKLQAQSGADAKGMLIPLLVAYFILTFGQSSLYSAFPLFSKAKLGMSAEQVGMQFFYIGLIAVFIQGYLIRKLTKKFKEEHIFTVGNVLMAIGLGLIPFAYNTLTLSIYLGIMAIGFSLNTPTIMSLLSKEAEEENIGAVMGTSQGISGLGRMLGPTWGGLLFGFSIGLPFYTTAIIIFGAVYIGIKLHHALGTQEVEEPEPVAESS